MKRVCRARYNFLLLLLILSGPLLSVSPEAIAKLGEKIWKNECGGTVAGLTHWNKGENFGSFGIGHFIWYPAGKKERFQETFPDLIKFLKEKKVDLPPWLEQAKGCPWKSREDFYRHIESPRMAALRELLFETRDLQAQFIVERLESVLPEMIKKLSPQERENVNEVFDRLSNDARGLYALVDYSNFKGLGTDPAETYKGQGWGLLQVLEQISPASQDMLADFVNAAQALLKERVKNSPPERHEEQWLNGWLNRVNSYKKLTAFSVR